MYYHKKDIAFLGHEPLLNKFRELKVHAKKLTKAVAKGDPVKARLLQQRAPQVTLDHLIKQRYPTFLDALQDLDDVLSLIALFAYLPANRDVASQITEECQRLYHEFLLYVVHTNSLRKVFLSLKGVYFQADIKGQAVTWLQPHGYIRKVGSLFCLSLRKCLNLPSFLAQRRR